MCTGCLLFGSRTEGVLHFHMEKDTLFFEGIYFRVLSII